MRRAIDNWSRAGRQGEGSVQGKIMRAMVLRGLRWPDPFPDLPDSEYYEHFSPWFREVKKRDGRKQ